MAMVIMRDEANHSRRIEAALILLTLITSAIHFADNAFRLDLYPGPAWFTRNGVLAAWLLVAMLAYFAWRSGTRAALVAYAAIGFAGAAHYLAPHRHAMPTRCIITIAIEAVASGLLIAYAMLKPRLKAF